MTRMIRGEIIIDNQNMIHNATIYIRLEDVSKADAPSRVLTEEILKNVHVDNRTKAIPFSLSVESLDEHLSYNVGVHIDVNKNGKLDKGDFISMESYPLDVHNFSDYIKIKVKQIK